VRSTSLAAHSQQLCYGAKCLAYVFDRATIGGATFSTMATEGKKFSRDSVVIMKDAGVYWAGRVRFFLSHMPPDAEVDIAHVHWYGKVPQGEAMSPTLNCPVFLKAFKDDQSGNMWPVDQLAPCKLGSVQDRTQRNRLVIVSRFASFLKHVPQFCSQIVVCVRH